MTLLYSESLPNTAGADAAGQPRTRLYVASAHDKAPLRVFLILPREVPAWLAVFLRSARQREWIQVRVALVEVDHALPRARRLPPDLRAYLALERLRRRRSGIGMLSRVDISEEAYRRDAPSPANPAELRADLEEFSPDIVMYHAGCAGVERIVDPARWVCWRIGDDLCDPRSAIPGLRPLLEGDLATRIELLLDVGHKRVSLANGNVATQAGSFALQREQILHKLPGLLLGGLRDVHAEHLKIPRNGTAILHLLDTDEAFSFGSGFRAFTVSLRHTVQWRRRLWYGGDTWFLAIRRAKELLDPVDPDIGEIAALVAPPGRYWADPCIVECAGRRLMFVEEYSVLESKGVIACLELLEDNKARRLGIALERPWHLSYPQVFESDGTWYLTVESGSVRRASLYRAASLPLLWEHVGDLLSGCQCVDPTLYQKDGYWYLFAGVSESGGSTCDELFLFVATSLAGPYEPHPSNPIVRDVRRARPAGPLFERHGRLIRPAQDCAPDYGAAIVFNEVLELSPTQYRERELSRLSPSWLPDLWGCHTYCSVAHAEVVDARGQPTATTTQIDVAQDQVLARDTTISLPLVSVIMPVYNGEQFIAQAIDSALAQTLRNIEVIVVDDGSSDASGSIADRYAVAHPKRVRVVHQANAGLPLARNAALAAARGRYLALLDADDIWLPDHLSICVDMLERDADIGLVHADSEYIDAEGTRFAVEEEQRWGRDARDPYREVLLRRQHIVCPTAVFRRSVVARVGQFDAAFNRLGCEDRDLWLRIAETSKVVYIEGVQALYRIHGSNMSANTERMWRARKLLVEKYAKRPRGRPLLRRARAAIDADHGHELAREPEIGPALGAFGRALWRDPLRTDAWKGLLRRVLIGRRPGAILRR